MKAGIVGLPNVGKSTLFNCLSNAKAQSANFPFCTIEPNIGVVNVPDPRLETLEALVKPERVQPATVEIVDIAGLVKGASKGEGLGNQFLANIRETDAIIHVLRCFDNDNIVHVDGSVNPIRDKETIDIELQLKDLETVEKKLEKVGRAARTGNKEALKEQEVLVTVKSALEASKNVRSIELKEEARLEFIKPLQLITDKPVLYVCNVDEASAKSGNTYVEQVKQAIDEEAAGLLLLAVSTEADINELESFEERQMFLEDLGLEEAGAAKLIRAAYALLNQQTYFTAGEKEVRAWTVAVGATAPQAA
ncbi:MAG: redox-regulated ATPase YchF, partial [Flavobacteriaceae bacterium]